MGWFSNLIEGGKAILEFGVKAVSTVVKVAVSAVKAVAKAVVETAVILGNNIKKAMAPVLATAVIAGNYISQEFNRLKQKLRDIFTNKSKKASTEEKLKLLREIQRQREELERLRAQLKKEQEEAEVKKNQQNQKPPLVIIGDSIDEAVDLEAKLERDILLDELQGVAEALLIKADEIEADERMQEVQNLARLNVSKDVLLQLTKQPETIRIHDRRFLELIGKFIANDIKKDTELDEFDTLIYERTNKSLLSIGNAHLTRLYTDQEKLLSDDTKQQKAELEEIKRKRNSLKRGVAMQEDGWETFNDKIAELEMSIKQLEDKLDGTNEHLYVTRTILSATEGIQQVVDNLNGAEWEEFDILDSIEICNLFIRLRNEGRRPTPEELGKIEEFGRSIRGRNSGFDTGEANGQYGTQNDSDNENDDDLDEDGLSPVPVS